MDGRRGRRCVAWISDILGIQAARELAVGADTVRVGTAGRKRGFAGRHGLAVGVGGVVPMGMGLGAHGALREDALIRRAGDVVDSNKVSPQQLRRHFAVMPTADGRWPPLPSGATILSKGSPPVRALSPQGNEGTAHHARRFSPIRFGPRTARSFDVPSATPPRSGGWPPRLFAHSAYMHPAYRRVGDLALGASTHANRHWIKTAVPLKLAGHCRHCCQTVSSFTWSRILRWLRRTPVAVSIQGCSTWAQRRWWSWNAAIGDPVPELPSPTS